VPSFSYSYGLETGAQRTFGGDYIVLNALRNYNGDGVVMQLETN
jgi:hypothetical protein